nr:MAG TPA: hypothetical protein [Caudoviricetes sp.]
MSILASSFFAVSLRPMLCLLFLPVPFVPSEFSRSSRLSFSH